VHCALLATLLADAMDRASLPCSCIARVVYIRTLPCLDVSRALLAAGATRGKCVQHTRARDCVYNILRSQHITSRYVDVDRRQSIYRYSLQLTVIVLVIHMHTTQIIVGLCHDNVASN